MRKILAIFIVVVTFLLGAMGCSSNEVNSDFISFVENDTGAEQDNSYLMSVNFDDEDVEVVYRCQYGAFGGLTGTPPQEVTFIPNASVVWYYWSFEKKEQVTKDVIDVLIQKEGKVLGYAVVKITATDYEKALYEAEVVKSVLLKEPITEQQAQSKINKYTKGGCA